MGKASKPWFASHTLWACILMLIVGALQVAGTISGAGSFSDGVKAVDWDAWVISAAGLIVGVVRVINGSAFGSPSPAIRWQTASASASDLKRRQKSVKSSILVVPAIVLLVMLATSALTTACSHGISDRTATVGKVIAVVTCGVVSTVCAVLSEDHAEWCEVGKRACERARETASDVLERLADTGTSHAPKSARSQFGSWNCASWSAACRTGHLPADACGAVRDGCWQGDHVEVFVQLE